MKTLAYFLSCIACCAQSVLEWDWNPAGAAVAGYRVFHGFASRQYTDVIDVGNTNQVLIEETPCGVPQFFAVIAYTIDGNESDFSAELRWVFDCPKPDAPGGLRISSRTNFVTLDWSADLQSWETIGIFQSTTNEKAFFRLKKL